MNDHLTLEERTALVGGELPGGELTGGDLASARVHLNHCLACANDVLEECLLKSAVAKSGQRYDAPAEFRERMASLLAPENSRRIAGSSESKPSGVAAWPAMARWVAAALVLLALSGWAVLAYRTQNVLPTGAAATAEIREACDLHIAALAASQMPQVVSSDRHTVKPWFQGKLPFSFNIPEALPVGVTLDGANLTYLDGRPAAQLLFHIDKHRASVFLREKDQAAARGRFDETRAGFRVIGVEAGNLELIAVSDVDPARLAALAGDIQGAQAHR